MRRRRLRRGAAVTTPPPPRSTRRSPPRCITVNAPGRGANVGTSLLATGVWATGTLVSAALAGGKPYELHDRNKPVNALTNPYQTADGRWFMLAAKPTIWPAMAKAIGRSDLLADPTFQRRTAIGAARRRVGRGAGRRVQRRNLWRTGRRLSTRPASPTASSRPRRGGRGSAAARRRHGRADRGCRGPGIHGQQPDHASRDSQGWPPGGHPSTAKHNDEVLGQLGFSADDIEQLRDQHVIPAAPTQEMTR